MENTAVTSPNEDPTPDGKQTAGKPAGDEPLKADDPNATADGKPDGESLETDSQEVEIVLRGEEGTQPKELDIDAIVRRRVYRAKKQVNAVQGELSETAQKLVVAEERIKMMQMSEDYQKAQSEIAKPPDPNDFDDGAQDAKYIAAQSDHQDKRIEAAVKKQTAHLTSQPAIDGDLERKRTNHYRRSVELGAKNFEEMEDKAIGILGQANADEIVKRSSKSAEILYYLGKHPDEAKELAELSNSDAWAAVSMIGRLEADLQVKRPAKANQAPNPDEELEGSIPPSQNASDRKLDKLREAAAIGGNADAMQRLMDFKRELKEKAAAS